MATTTIQVKNRTRDLLGAIAEKGESYDDVIKELVEIREAHIENLLRTLNEGEFVPLEEALREIERSTGARGSKEARRSR